MKSRFRIWVATLGGFLLPLPLIWLIYLVFLKPFPGAPPPQELAFVPMLSIMERLGTLTYHRECHADNDCDPRLRCFFSVATGSHRCTDSRCMVDKNCPDGFSCQTYLTDDRNALINACTLIGHRKEGEVCNSFAGELEYGCERGLICHGRCGRPCEPGNPAACPEGFFCDKTPKGSLCQPTCEGRACPEGQRCVALGGRRSVCAKVHGQDCRSVPCGPGLTCAVNDYPHSAHEVWMRCVQRCNLKGAAPCPEATVCVVHSCRKLCTPGDPAACGEGYRCESSRMRPPICSADVPDNEAAP